MMSVISVVAAVHVSGIHQVAIDIIATSTAPVIVSQQPDDEPDHTSTNIEHIHRVERGDYEHSVSHDVGDQFPIFSHETLHSGLSSKAKQCSSFRVSIQ